jgi:hypothetical protein
MPDRAWDKPLELLVLMAMCGGVAWFIWVTRWGQLWK